MISAVRKAEFTGNLYMLSLVETTEHKPSSRSVSRLETNKLILRLNA